MVTGKNSSRLTSDQSLYFQLDDDKADYFSPLDAPEYTFPSTTACWGSEPEPLTVLSLPRDSFKLPRDASVETLVQNAIDNDDVISPRWLQKVAVVHDGDNDDDTESGISGSQLECLKNRYGTTDITLDSRIPMIDQNAKHGAPTVHTLELVTTRDVASGAYLAKSMDGVLKLYPVYRLHPDKTSAHVTGCYPSPEGDGTYKTLNKTDSRKHNLIPVRSKSSGSGPRVTVKDIYDVQGLVTGNGSRICTEHGEPAKANATSIQALLDSEVQIVGKTQCNEFAGRGPNIEENTQFSYPWSLRADGYQSVGGSSSGAASALIAADYLDAALTSDTCGSTLYPAGCSGLYGMRPTHGAVSMQGVLSFCPESDTVGIMSRDPAILTDLARKWFSTSDKVKPHTKLPKEVLVPSDDLKNMSSDVKNRFETFIEKVSHNLGMTVKYINMSIEGPNEEKCMITPAEFRLLNLADQWRDVGKEFVDDYEKANDGRWPPLGGYTRSGWKKAKAEHWSEEDFGFYKDKLAKTGEMITKLFRPNQESISESIFINLWDPSSYPYYREKSLLADHLTPPSVQPVSPVHLPAYSGCPTIVAPFDQVPFNSVISGKEEMHPLAVSMMGPQGSDLMLAEIVDKLTSADILKTVKTGREAF
ncbi:uncharacterized protein L199_005211 [Kwoniella botswanensis]|uniref:uncharacterized protein n=1 Tax=Kwoniella botswanensis TaxID=1268659 RepID=UPI00315D65D7